MVNTIIQDVRDLANAIKSAVDGVTTAIRTVSYEHHEVHSGSHYEVRINKDVANAGTFCIAFTTPDTTKWSHVVFGVSVEVEADVKLYEAIESFADGTPITPINSNRNSDNTSGIIDMVFDPTLTLGTPTTLGHTVLGSGRASGGEGRAAEEFVLKQNTTYCFLVTNQTSGATNEINFNLTWYEHTNN